MRALLALWERHYTKATKRRNATHHRPVQFSQAMTTRRKP